MEPDELIERLWRTVDELANAFAPAGVPFVLGGGLAFVDDLRYLGKRFATPDGAGPAAFFDVIRATLGTAATDESAEDDIRAVVSDSVRRVLAPWMDV